MQIPERAEFNDKQTLKLIDYCKSKQNEMIIENEKYFPLRIMSKQILDRLLNINLRIYFWQIDEFTEDVIYCFVFCKWHNFDNDS